MASTAATPIVMPTIVSDVCNRLRRRARMAMVKLDRNGTLAPSLQSGRPVLAALRPNRRQLGRRSAVRVVRRVAHNAPVREADDARPVLGHLWFGGDEHDRNAPL